jgi:hypothetical protein
MVFLLFYLFWSQNYNCGCCLSCFQVLRTGVLKKEMYPLSILLTFMIYKIDKNHDVFYLLFGDVI